MIPILAMTSKTIRVTLINSPSCGTYLSHKGRINSVDLVVKYYPLMKYTSALIDICGTSGGCDRLLAATVRETTPKAFARTMVALEQIKDPYDHPINLVTMHILSAVEGRLDHLKWLAGAYPISKTVAQHYGYSRYQPSGRSGSASYSIHMDHIMLRACVERGDHEAARWVIDQYYTEDEAKKAIGAKSFDELYP
jgi:hypothetical protein